MVSEEPWDGLDKGNEERICRIVVVNTFVALDLCSSFCSCSLAPAQDASRRGNESRYVNDYRGVADKVGMSPLG